MRLTDLEIERIAQFLNLSQHEFIQTYTRLTQARQGLAIADKPNGECAFLEKGGCRVQPVKPQQCRDFPNLWNFPGFKAICHAKEHIVSESEYRERIQDATGRDPADLPPS